MKKAKLCLCEEPYYSKGLCRNCYEKQLRENNSEFYEKQKSNSRVWTTNNKERKSNSDKQRRKRVGPESEKRFFSFIKRKYGMSQQDYEKLVTESNNCCNICDRPPYKGKRLHLDHNHKTGKVRGLLCARCNWYLSTIENGNNILDKIKNYLNE